MRDKDDSPIAGQRMPIESRWEIGPPKIFITEEEKDEDGDRVRLRIVQGEDPEGSENSMVQRAMLVLFEECLTLQRKKARTYGAAFRSQGYMGNVARVLSKASRLKKMMWNDGVIVSSDESVEDTMKDLINLACFFLINYFERNKWGN